MSVCEIPPVIPHANKVVVLNVTKKRIKFFCQGVVMRSKGYSKHVANIRCNNLKHLPPPMMAPL